MKSCKCGREITGRGYRATRCAECAAADPWRHSGRDMPSIIVSVDSETKWSDLHNRQIMVTLSYGREDGTSGTIYRDDCPEGGQELEMFARLLHILVRPVTGPDNRPVRQVPKAFYFGHDTAVLAASLDLTDTMLIQKAQISEPAVLCDGNHPEEECDYARTYGRNPDAHRRGESDQVRCLTDGYYGKTLVWDPTTSLAVASSAQLGLHMEYRPHGDRYEEWQRCVIRDTGRSFTGGLESAIEQWNPELADHERAVIAWGKEHRQTGFVGASKEQIAEYSEAECVAHARLCRMLLDAVRDAAHVIIKPERLGGSGSIAAAVMSHYKVTKRKHTTECDTLVYGNEPVSIDQLPWLDYFGGLIEGPVVGILEGEVDEEDINSAYPSKMVELPCMDARHGGEWKTVDVREKNPHKHLPKAALGHAWVAWNIRGKETGTAPFLVRDITGHVIAPQICAGAWVTLPELRAALKRFPRSVLVYTIIYWQPGCPCKPFDFMPGLYKSRQGIKAQMKSLEKYSPEWWKLSVLERAIKLMINSIYGKLAQKKHGFGPFTNLHWASHITGATRAQVRELTWKRESEGAIVVYQHTDSVLSIGGNAVHEGDALGQWGLEKPSIDFMIAQPGLAMALKGGKVASRGCKKPVFMDAGVTWVFGANPTDFTQNPAEWPKIVTEQTVMITQKQAVARGKRHLAGSFELKVTEVSIVSRKRDFRFARPIPGQPRAWFIPPAEFVRQQAKLADVLHYQENLKARRRRGELDE